MPAILSVSTAKAPDTPPAPRKSSHLISQGHTVHIASFDRGLANLRKDFPVTEIFGWRITYVNNQVRYRRTLAKIFWPRPKPPPPSRA